MDFGVLMIPTEFAMDVSELGREAEARGFESLWFPEHTHMPTATTLDVSVYLRDARALADESRRILDPFVVLGAVAAATSRIKLGTGICLVTQRDPILLAKEVASVDFLSQGRLLFGIGAGWNQPEIENHGVPYARRFRVMRERIQAMKAIWTNDVAEYHGDFVNFDPINSWPKPIQRPHPPIIVGGDGPLSVQHAVEYGDGWLPHTIGGGAPLADRIAAINQKLAEAGRQPIPITVFGARDDDEIAEYRSLGVSRCVFWLPSRPRDEVMPVLDRYAALQERSR
jgi:probable F420-dependent oxidoreductase